MFILHSGRNITSRFLPNKISSHWSPFFLRTSRDYCMEKCYEEKKYDEALTELIGNREMVGYGWNGTPCYYDRADFPFPSIRYKEPTPDILALKEKERGDWRLLSIQDKKELYRASFCQTFSEFKYPYSDWMAVFGWALIFSSLGFWGFIFINYYIHNPKPRSFQWNYKQAALKRMIDLHVNPIRGLTSNYDYEKKEWKNPGLLSFIFGPPPNPYAVDEEEEVECDED